MLEKMGILPSYRIYNKEFIINLSDKLSESGFQCQSIQIPLNYKKTEKKTNFSLDEYLNRNTNYSAIIFSALNQSKDEQIKIFFVNHQDDNSFLDEIFPSAKNRSSSVYVASHDPARSEYLYQYFYDYISEAGERVSLFSLILPFVALIFGSIDGYLLLSYQRGLINYILQLDQYINSYLNLIIEIVFLLFIISVFFLSFQNPSDGLFINDKPFIRHRSYCRVIKKSILWLILTFFTTFLGYLFINPIV